MCGLCGMLGGPGHWTERRAAPDAHGGPEQTHTFARERLDNAALVNRVLRHYRVRLKPWSGSSYVLSGGTGKTVLVENLAQMWAAAEKLAGRPLDPLDEALLADLDDPHVPS